MSGFQVVGSIVFWLISTAIASKIRDKLNDKLEKGGFGSDRISPFTSDKA
ncbi:MAG: hypothetical protein QF832_23620 [SAR324 cluster bacterium]|jgi:hypothetical protein|nr:hypothetical protein [SAR324 cluster bacterium]